MIAYAAPLAYTVFLWWSSTGVILYLDKLPRDTHVRSFVHASILHVAALGILIQTRNDPSSLGAYAAFTASVFVWGWQEMAFLMGFVTGPRAQRCPAGVPEMQRFISAVQSILYHELALGVSAALILAITWTGSNHAGLWAFVTLWLMRLSAKLNLFLGVRNRGEEFLPDHLRYLESFFKHKPINLFFPLSVLLACLVASTLWQQVFQADPVGGVSIQLNLTSSLLSLGILEHGLMILPLPTSALWSWGMRSGADIVSERTGTGLEPIAAMPEADPASTSQSSTL